MQKTRIEWVRNPDGSQGYSWNPIKGVCPVQCKLPDGRPYCYGRNNYRRFKRNPHPQMSKGFFDDILKMGRASKPRGTFVCSTFELFHPITKNPCPWYYEVDWRYAIFHEIESNPQHRFYILTKFPQNIDRPMPDNVWLGVTITGWEDYSKKTYIEKAQAKTKFISFEPLLTEMPWLDLWLEPYEWIIIGRLTQHGHKYDPPREWIRQLVLRANACKCKIFLKDNLKEIWGEPLIQEFPKG